MADIHVTLPSNFKYQNQFAPSAWARDPSLLLCGEASTAMAAEIAYPGKWVPEELIAELCQRWTGSPDTRANPRGTTREEIVAWLQEQHVGHIDLADLVAIAGQAELHQEIMAQNKNGVPQIVTVADESQLYEAVPDANDANGAYMRGPKLHNWQDKGMGHVMLRVGYSDDHAYGFYMEPAAPGFAQPVKILLSDMNAANVITAIAIMPHGMPQPPAGFRFSQHGPWPAPKPVLDIAKVQTTVGGMMQAVDALKAAVSTLAADLAALGKEEQAEGE